MRRPHDPDHQARLLPAGRRWGFGAHSVVQYLSHSLQRPGGAGGEDGSIRNPVFPQMEKTLRDLRRQH